VTATNVFGRLLVAMAVVAVSSAGTAAPKQSELIGASGEAKVGKEAPWFAAWTPGNAVINTKVLFKDDDTRRVAYVFFATYCEPCRFGLSLIKQNKARLEAAGVRVVLVDYMEEASEVKPYLEKMGLKGFIVALDKFGQNGRKFGIEKKTKSDVNVTLPRTFIIGRDGKVKKVIGAEGDDYVEQLVN
jgi:peroxiredoxin